MKKKENIKKKDFKKIKRMKNEKKRKKMKKKKIKDYKKERKMINICIYIMQVSVYVCLNHFVCFIGLVIDIVKID